MTHEARINETEAGSVPADDGWFILNLADVAWQTVPTAGAWSAFDAPSAPSRLLGFGLHVLWPGDRPGYYHSESNQEGFLVLSGECLAIVEGEERPMGAGDYLHCPPGTRHILVGAGDGPCAIVMAGTRAPGMTVEYVADPVAARYGASVEATTTDAREAYASRPPLRGMRSPWPV
jgi:uncharacterized cupin superfamily protein